MRQQNGQAYSSHDPMSIWEVHEPDVFQPRVRRKNTRIRTQELYRRAVRIYWRCQNQNLFTVNTAFLRTPVIFFQFWIRSYPPYAGTLYIQCPYYRATQHGNCDGTGRWIKACYAITHDLLTDIVKQIKDKATLVKVWTGPEGSRRLRLPDFGKWRR